MNKTLSIYKNKKIVVTGATGFKGSWLCFWLHLLKANIVGISLKPEKDSILYKKLSIHKKIKQYFINIQDSKKLDKVIKKNKLTIRNPNAVRPWQHVLEPLHGYLILGNYLMSNKLNNKILPNWNFGPNFKNIKSVNEILTKSLELWGKKKKIVFKNNKKFKEVNFLMLNSNKAKKEISWRPKLNFNDTMKLTVDWYKSFYKKENLESITKKQIEFFLKK